MISRYHGVQNTDSSDEGWHSLGDGPPLRHMVSTLPREPAIEALIDEIVRAKPSVSKGRYIKKITLATTMGPGIHVDPTRTKDIDEELAAEDAAAEAVQAS